MLYSVARTPNWHLNLADAVDAAQPNDTISVQTSAMLELAVIALRRKNKHEMGICVEVWTEPTVNGACVVEKRAEENVSNAQAYLLGLMPDELPAEPFVVMGRSAPADVDRTGLPDAVTLPTFDPKLVAAAKARAAEYTNLGFLNHEMIRHRVSEYTHLPPTRHTTRKPTEEEIAAHQKAHGIKPSDLLPPYSPNDPALYGLGKYRRYLPKTEGASPKDKIMDAAVGGQEVATGPLGKVDFKGIEDRTLADGVTVVLGKPGVPNANGDVYSAEGWAQAIKEYGEKIKSGEVVPKMCFEIDSMSGAMPDTEAKGLDPKIVASILDSPEYACQNCGKEYLYVDAKKVMAERSAVCFCSTACADKYVAKNKRWPGVGGEILLGEPQLCTYGRTEQQIRDAQNALIAKFAAQDRELVEAVLNEAPVVVVQDSVVYDATQEQIDTIQRLFRLRSKLPKGFKIVADVDPS